ncbi:hypothetical protein [Treponema sp. R6D11]
MRKSAVFLVLSLFLLGFFACQIPTAIEIIGTPSVRFAETVDIGKMFTDLLTEAINKDDRLTIIPCSKTDSITCLIHAELVNQGYEEIKVAADIDTLDFYGREIDSGDVEVTLLQDKTLIKTNIDDDPMIVPLSELSSLLPGFMFSGYKTKLYLSGSKIIEKSTIRMIVEEIDDPNPPIITTTEKSNLEDESSAINDWKIYGYSETSCPSSGIDLTIPITGKDVKISFEVYIPSGTKIRLTDFDGNFIKVEVLVWLPFEFEAGNDGAELSFPDDSFFSSEDDLFCREEPDSESLFTDFIESLSVGVKFKNSPFNGADLVISSKGIDIHNGIENDTLSFTLTEENMKAINEPENYPFVPKIKIDFPPHAELKFSRLFYAVEFSFQAKIRYRKDFL